MEPQEFKRQLDELRTIINNGIAYFLAWRSLMVDDENSARALNRYRGFFLPARDALLKMTLMQFAKVFDRNPKTISLRNLLHKAKVNREKLTPYATEKDLREIEEKVDTSKGLLDRLKCHRDQRLAHHDAIIADSMHLPYGEVRKLVEEIKSMYNSLTKGHNQSITHFESLAHDAEKHTSEVVRIICKQRQSH